MYVEVVVGKLQLWPVARHFAYRAAWAGAAVPTGGRATGGLTESNAIPC